MTITNIIQNTAQLKPLIIVIEDIQWIDLATLDILSHIISQTSSIPVFFIFSLQTLIEHEVKNINILKFIRRLRRLYRFDEILLNPLSKFRFCKKSYNVGFHLKTDHLLIKLIRFCQ